MWGPTSGSESLRVSQRRHEGTKIMNNDFLVSQAEYQYRAERNRRQLQPVRHRKWRKRLEWDGPRAATDVKNWIN
jgi:hypothetical protein